MDPSPLAGLFKNSNYDKPIANDEENAIGVSSLKEKMKLSALLYLYEVFLENRESDNCYEVLKEEFYKVIDESPLNDKHECNVVNMYSMNINYANDMQSYKLGDDEFDENDLFCPPSNEEVIKENAIGICSLDEKYDWNKHDNLYDSSDEDDTLDENIAFYDDTMSVGTIDDDFVMPTTYYDDHDWGDNYDTSCDLENLFKPHDEYIIDNYVCNIIESGFGRVSTLGKKNPTCSENIQSHEFF